MDVYDEGSRQTAWRSSQRRSAQRCIVAQSARHIGHYHRCPLLSSSYLPRHRVIISLCALPSLGYKRRAHSRHRRQPFFLPFPHHLCSLSLPAVLFICASCQPIPATHHHINSSGYYLSHLQSRPTMPRLPLSPKTNSTTTRIDLSEPLSTPQEPKYSTIIRKEDRTKQHFIFIPKSQVVRLEHYSIFSMSYD